MIQNVHDWNVDDKDLQAREDLGAPTPTKARGTILLVTPSEERCNALVVWLAGEGYAPAVVDSFEHARSELETGPPPALLITDIRLGAFNGLQLVIRERLRGSSAQAIVLGPHDPVLETEARRQGAVFLPLPVDRTSFLAAVSTQLACRKTARRSPRRSVPRVEATVDERPARLLDISYDGLRFEIVEQAQSLPTSFSVRLRSFPGLIHAERRWVSRQEVDDDLPVGQERERASEGEEQSPVIQCGAQLTQMDKDTFSRWRSLVDSISQTTSPN